MNFTCKECNDTGSRDKSGDYLDCGHCDAAMQRKALNDWLASQYHQGAIAKVDSMDAWLIHQRALAMAPKQEAPHDGLREVSGKIIKAMESSAAPINLAHALKEVSEQGGRIDFAPDLMAELLAAYSAAPAATNGAPELPSAEFTTDMHIDGRGVAAYSADQMRTYGQACHALGRGAAVREYVENGTFKQPAAAAGPDAALIDEREAFEAKYGPKDAFAWRNADDTYKVYSLQMAWEIWQARAALSGAKGN